MRNSLIQTLNQYFSVAGFLKNPCTFSLPLLFFFLFLSGCSSVRQMAFERDVAEILKRSELFSSHFTGFSLFDIEKNAFVASTNSTLLFTPASNTKILTMYVTLKSFRDSIPSFLYQKNGNVTHIQPFADPTFLYQPFKEQPGLHFLNNQKSIHVHLPEDALAKFGSGWAWDDYKYAFQTERSWFPIYGNAVEIARKKGALSIIPSFFTDFTELIPGDTSRAPERELASNLFKMQISADTASFEARIPFIGSRELLLQLLSDTLKVPVRFADSNNEARVWTDTLFSQPVDSVLALMMKPSDNFLAEQLLIQCARQNGYDNIQDFITFARTVWLPELNDMVWVDGSGLSRYNLIAPVDQVRLLKKCYDEFGWDRLKGILTCGGEGTLEDWYLSDTTYLYGKTGTLSNNHNLSGFLITDTGKILIFSFMNNHFTKPTEEVKEAMEAFILDLKRAY